MENIYGFKFFYNGKEVDIRASSLYTAKLKAIEHFKPPKSKQYMVHGGLCEKNGEQVTHIADF